MGNEKGMVHMKKERMGCVGREWKEGGRGNLRRRIMDIGKYFEYRGNRNRGIGEGMREQSILLGHV